MNLWNRIKYHLLHWLLDDICEKSGEFDERTCARGCKGCELNKPCEISDFISPCTMHDIYVQAYRVWMHYR